VRQQGPPVREQPLHRDDAPGVSTWSALPDERPDTDKGRRTLEGLPDPNPLIGAIEGSDERVSVARDRTR
jgi:hypothetical protein